MPLGVPGGVGALRVLADLRAALDGSGPALAPHPVEQPPPGLPTTGGDDLPPDLPPGVALVIGTSGSTGRPKRALLTASALRASAEATHARLGGPGQWVLAMPAHHVAGIQVLVRSLVAGTHPVAVDTTDGFTVKAFAAATRGLAEQHPRHYTALVPTQLVRLLDDPTGRAALRRYDAVLLGGAATPPSLRARAADAGVRVTTTYGMSETAGGCVYDGRPLDGSRVRLDEGRISLGGPTLAEGYLGEPELTAAAFTRDGAGTRWFLTDDLGTLDEDGRLRVEGRVDDLVNTGGVKVAPRLVEDALLAHVPGVTEAVVVGVPDPEWGQAVGAALVVSPPHQAPTVGEVRARLRGILPDHALPRTVRTLEAIPLRGPGKPDRIAVRTCLADVG